MVEVGLICAIGWLILTVALGWGVFLDIMGRRTLAEGPGFGPQVILAALVLVLLSFLAYSVASLRTDRPSRTIGYLLLVPFITFLVLILMFIGSMVYGTDIPDGLSVALFGVVAVSIIAIGAKLSRDRRRSGWV